MKTLRKWNGLAVWLVVILLIGTLAACSKANNAGSPSTGSDSPTVREEPIEIKWLGFFPYESNGNSVVEKYLNEKFNVKLTAMKIEKNSWQEQLNIKLASGDIPDVFWLWDQVDISTFSNQGLLAELPVDMIKEHMPNYAKTVDEVDPNLWEFGKMEGKSYAIPLYWSDGMTPFLPGYNGAWLKAIGYEAPPTTLEELEDVLTKFRNGDPDGNGKKDTYGTTARGKNGLDFAFNSVFGAFGVQPYQWVEDGNGKLVFGMTTEKARQGFKLLNKWYDAGLVDPEFITVDGNRETESFVNGRIGMMDGGLYYNYTAESKIVTGLKGQNPNNELVVGKIVDGPNGPGAGFAWGSKNNYIGMGIQVAKDPKKMQKIFEMLDALATDKEVYVMASSGKEGVHYEMVDGKPVAKEEFKEENKRAQEALGFYSLFSGKSLPMQDMSKTQAQLDFRKQLVDGVPVMVDKKSFSVPAEAEHPDLRKVLDQYYIKFITGEVDLDKGFDDFVALWKQSGGQEITDQVNAKFAEMKESVK